MNKFDCLYLTFIFNHSYTLFISICMLKVCLYRTNFSLLLSRILVYDVGIIVNIKSQVPQISHLKSDTSNNVPQMMS